MNFISKIKAYNKISKMQGVEYIVAYTVQNEIIVNVNFTFADGHVIGECIERMDTIDQHTMETHYYELECMLYYNIPKIMKNVKITMVNLINSQ